jgi:RNA polymerase sigma-70 factor (ECF subfamily)
MAAAALDSYTWPQGDPSTFEDRALVDGILSGDERCFDALYARHRGRIFGFALNRLGDSSEAEDVTQEVFLQIHRSLASFQGRSTLLTWMFGIAHNQVCRRFRKKTPPMISIDDPEAAAVPASVCPSDRTVDATRLLRHTSEIVETELSPSQREIFYLRFCEGGNRGAHSAIAERLGKSRQAVKISLFRSRRTLAAHNPEVSATLAP